MKSDLLNNAMKGIESGLSDYLLQIQNRLLNYIYTLLTPQVKDILIRLLFIFVVGIIVYWMYWREKDLIRKSREIESFKYSGPASFKQAWDNLDSKGEKRARMSEYLIFSLIIGCGFSFSLMPMITWEINLILSVILAPIIGKLCFDYILTHYVQDWFYTQKEYKVYPNAGLNKFSLIVFSISIFLSISLFGSYLTRFYYKIQSNHSMSTMFVAFILLLVMVTLLTSTSTIFKRNMKFLKEGNTGKLNIKERIQIISKDRALFIAYFVIPVGTIILLIPGLFKILFWASLIEFLTSKFIFIPIIFFPSVAVISDILWSAANTYLGTPVDNEIGTIQSKNESEDMSVIINSNIPFFGE